jgi:hypothetical protein
MINGVGSIRALCSVLRSATLPQQNFAIFTHPCKKFWDHENLRILKNNHTSVHSFTWFAKVNPPWVYQIFFSHRKHVHEEI